MLKQVISALSFVLAAAILCLHVTAGDADAARFGGGKSFGGSPSYSRSAPAPQVSRQAPNAQTGRQQGVQPGAAAPGMARPGMGGMLGGILAGTLLGSLLFGGPHAGFGMLDIALIALVGFMALKLLRVFMRRHTAATGGSSGPGRPETFQSRQTPDPWDRLRDQSAPGPAAASSTTSPVADADVRIEGFDRDDFLRGAKVLYARLQESWDNRDLDDIATFATPAILNEVRAQAEADPQPSKTEIILINANLVGVERDGDDDVATVYFDVLLRDNPEADTPSQARELWHFIRPAGSSESWRLDGIQQVS